MALQNGNWWDIGRPIVKNVYDIEASDFSTGAVVAGITSGTVVSEKLSANAIRRTVVFSIPALGAGSTNPLTSAFVVWKPRTAVQVAGFTITPQAAWLQTTLQTTMIATLYAGAGANIGTVTIPSSSGLLRGALTSGVLSASPYSVPALTVLSFGLTAATSSGMDIPAHELVIDYDSTA